MSPNRAPLPPRIAIDFQAGIEKPRGMSRIEVVETQSVITNEV
jgi:hypothetical protein